GVEPDTTSFGGDPAVLRDARLQFYDGALPWVGRRQLLLARRHHLDRPSTLTREESSEVLDTESQLATEATADARHHHSNLRGPGLEKLRERVLNLERGLGVGPDGALAGTVPRRHRRPRLRVPLVHHAGAEPVLEDVIGLLEAALHITHDDPRAMADIALAL